jgi:SOS-response transcriptional repressor LexA
MTKLTVRESEVLDCIIGYMIAKHRYPTLRELMARLDIMSISAVQVHLDALVRKEYIVRFAYRDRGMKVLRNSLGDRIKFVTKVVVDE